MNKGPRRILRVFQTHEQAKADFEYWRDKIGSLHGVRCFRASLRIEHMDMITMFFSLGRPIDSIRGLHLDKVIVNELVEMTPELEEAFKISLNGSRMEDPLVLNNVSKV